MSNQSTAGEGDSNGQNETFIICLAHTMAQALQDLLPVRYAESPLSLMHSCGPLGIAAVIANASGGMCHIHVAAVFNKNESTGHWGKVLLMQNRACDRLPQRAPGSTASLLMSFVGDRLD